MDTTALTKQINEQKKTPGTFTTNFSDLETT